METLLPSQIIENRYDSDTLQKIKNYMREHGVETPYVHNWEGPKFGKTLSIKYKINFYDHQELQDLIISGLPKEIADSMIVVAATQLKSYFPYEIHCDCGWFEYGENEAPFYVFIIPLETVDARTITFNQTATYLHFVEYKEHNEPLPVEEQMTEEVYQQHLSHCWPQERPYLSIDKIFAWKQGSVFMFDIRKWHSSDNFPINGVNEKNCVVLMTKTTQNKFDNFINNA